MMSLRQYSKKTRIIQWRFSLRKFMMSLRQISILPRMRQWRFSLRKLLYYSRPSSDLTGVKFEMNLAQIKGNH